MLIPISLNVLFLYITFLRICRVKPLALIFWYIIKLFFILKIILVFNYFRKGLFKCMSIISIFPYYYMSLSGKRIQTKSLSLWFKCNHITVKKYRLQRNDDESRKVYLIRRSHGERECRSTMMVKLQINSKVIVWSGPKYMCQDQRSWKIK